MSHQRFPLQNYFKFHLLSYKHNDFIIFKNRDPFLTDGMKVISFECDCDYINNTVLEQLNKAYLISSATHRKLLVHILLVYKGKMF